jgi:hypothetical protein
MCDVTLIYPEELQGEISDFYSLSDTGITEMVGILAGHDTRSPIIQANCVSHVVLDILNVTAMKCL